MKTSSNIEASTTLRLAHASEKFIAVKEASANMMQVMKIIKNRPPNFLVISGDDTLALPTVAAGGDGVISVIANALPKEFSDLTRAALAGNFAEARRLNELLLDLHHWLYVEGNPAGIKATLELLRLCRQNLRLPLSPVSDEIFAAIQAELERIKQ